MNNIAWIIILKYFYFLYLIAVEFNFEYTNRLIHNRQIWRNSVTRPEWRRRLPSSIIRLAFAPPCQLCTSIKRRSPLALAIGAILTGLHSTLLLVLVVVGSLSPREVVQRTALSFIFLLGFVVKKSTLLCIWQLALGVGLRQIIYDWVCFCWTTACLLGW